MRYHSKNYASKRSPNYLSESINEETSFQNLKGKRQVLLKLYMTVYRGKISGGISKSVEETIHEPEVWNRDAKEISQHEYTNMYKIINIRFSFTCTIFYQPYRKVYIIINLNHDHNIPKSNGPKPFIEKFQILLLKFIWEKSFTKILPIRCIQKNNLLGKFSMKTIHKKRNFLEPHEKLLLV